MPSFVRRYIKAHGSDAVDTRRGSAAKPLVLLLLALATLLLFDGRGQPVHGAHRAYHEGLTWHHMTIAQNLSPEHGFLGFARLTRVADGDLAYRPYNRFPVLGHALVKLATLPFPNDISARLSAARALMLVFFAATVMLAYLALCRLAGNRWTALAATLLAFSSYYALFYRDMVATEGVVDLFGMMLVLHGIAVFATEGRFGQLLAKTCVALLLGWHVYALLLPFVALGLVAAFRCRDGQGIRRHLTLGAFAFAFGALVLAANFTREYLAFDGEVAPMQLPSVESMLMRTGFGELQVERGEERDGDSTESRPVRVAPPEDVTAWPALAARQLKHIAWSVPYAIGHFVGVGKPIADLAVTRMVLVLGGVVVSVLVVAVALFLFLSPATRHRIPLAALALSGPVWTFGMANHSFFPFEGLFNVGIPLAFFALALPHLDRLLGSRGCRGRCAMLAGVAAVPTFALSSFLMARAIASSPEQAVYEKTWAAEIDAIREVVERGETILVSDVVDGCGNERSVDWKFYLSGYATVRFSNRHLADFVVSEQRIEGARTLTPSNRLVFLYDRASHDDALRRHEKHVADGTPVLESPDHDVYFIERDTGNELLYFRDHCPNDQIYDRFHAQHILMGGARVFVHVWPADANDLPVARRQFGFDALMDFQPRLLGWRKDGKCYAVCRLPDGIAKVRTGSVMGRGTSPGVVWERNFSAKRPTGEVLDSPPAAEPR